MKTVAGASKPFPEKYQKNARGSMEKVNFLPGGWYSEKRHIPMPRIVLKMLLRLPGFARNENNTQKVCDLLSLS